MSVFDIDFAVKTVFRSYGQKRAVFHTNIECMKPFFRFRKRQTAGRDIFQNIADQTAEFCVIDEAFCRNLDILFFGNFLRFK